MRGNIEGVLLMDYLRSGVRCSCYADCVVTNLAIAQFEASYVCGGSTDDIVLFLIVYGFVGIAPYF